MKPASMQHKAKGLSLERFAGAKQSSYDKKAKKAKELALNAKKVNNYRKLKQRLANQGLLGPIFKYGSQEDVEEQLEPYPKRPRSEEPRMDRIKARAGPAPDSEESSEGEDMVGGESESDGDGDSAEADGASVEEAGMLRRTLAKQGQQQAAAARSVPAAHQSLPPLNASSEGTAGSGRKQEPSEVSGRHQLYAAATHTGEGPSAGSSARHSLRDEETEHAQKRREGNGRAEGHLGRKQKRGNKGKPQSQLQLMQAQVQAQKEAEQREREERRRRIEEHNRQVVEAEKRRKQHTKMLRKRNYQGQPVMRYRMDKILGQLQAEAGQQ